MKRCTTLTTAILCLLPTLAIAHDSWTGPDKKLHAEVGVLIGAVGTVVTAKPWHGLGLACAAGGAKELYDMAHREKHTASWRDFIVTCAAGGVGAFGGHLILTQIDRPRVLNEQQDRKIYLVYSRQFD